MKVAAFYPSWKRLDITVTRTTYWKSISHSYAIHVCKGTFRIMQNISRLLSVSECVLKVVMSNDDTQYFVKPCLTFIFQILDVENVIIVVSRWFGGILLGADRFKLINNCTRDILQECHYISKKVQLFVLV